MEPASRFLRIGSLSDRIGATEEWRGDAVVMRGRRQAILASNIANVDTPGYKARDLSFADTMEDALTRANGPQLDAKADRHFGPESMVRPRSTLELAGYEQPDQPQLDNNSVDMNTQTAKIAKNSILYELAMQVYEDELKEFKAAAGDPRTASR
ncbi:flagellar basal body rod protein FlgB [Pseudorhodoferax aquiterrae]|uniref:Flagellar basal body rod protein FlgB n=1 Tax=Pseudorhodoferax aquiterrae TaxID=747304 RepID=A0ABQ3G655_9BURK|nr:flagellar basal body rod protein FlgB [Pseudorhodoferax aquiterrae]GHC92846.1 flagellar basal body rod protein FlgB [Pseudorhodoferax aquiterrae]